MQTQFLVATLIAAARIVEAGNPACFLAALGKQSNPADVEALCGEVQDAMLGNLTQVCEGSELSAAYDAYAETCQASGMEVGALPITDASEDDADGGSSGGSGSGNGDSSSGSGSDGDSGDNEDAANGISPSLVFVITGLAATSLTSILFL